MKKLLLLFGFFLFSCKGYCQQTSEREPLLQKENMYTGLTFNFDVNKTENEDQLLGHIEDRKNNTFNINLNSGYFIKDNWALGARIAYGSRKRVGRDINLLNIPVDVNNKETVWGLYASMKNYLPLDKNHRFYLYNLLLLGGGISNEVDESTTLTILKTTTVKSKLVELRVVPGIMVNVVKGFTLEAGADIAGFRSAWSQTMVNSEPATKKSQVSADLTINLLRFSLGLYYYFGFHHKK